MKKLLNISVIAALAILPLAANATDLTNDQLTYANPATDDGATVATTKYVKGAYKELGTAINTKQDKLSTDEMNAIRNVSGLDTRLATAETDIDALQAAVGDTTAGLVKDVADLNTSLATKADAETTYTKEEVDTELAKKADISTTYTKEEVNTELAKKADALTTYTKTEVDTALDAKADALTTYTKTEVDTKLGTKADAETTYTKTDVDTKLGTKQDSLTDTQLNAVNSGITAAMVASYENLVQDSANSATKAGVTATINASNVTIPVLTTWGSNTATNMEASIAAATYTEPAPAVEQQ